MASLGELLAGGGGILKDVTSFGIGAYGNIRGIDDQLKQNEFERRSQMTQNEIELMRVQGENQAAQNAFLSQMQLSETAKKVLGMVLIGIGLVAFIFAIKPRKKGRK